MYRLPTEGANIRSKMEDSSPPGVRYGSSVIGMPPIWAYRGSDGELMIFDGVTRATRIALLLPGIMVRVEVVGDLPSPCGTLPTVGDQLP